MNRTEILKLALEKAANPQEAMALAREMDAFLTGGAPLLALPAPAPMPAAPNGRRAWHKEDITRLTDLYTSGKTPPEIAQVMGRTIKAVEIALNRLARGAPFGTRRAYE